MIHVKPNMKRKQYLKNLVSKEKHLASLSSKGHQSLLSNEPEKWMKAVKLFLEKKIIKAIFLMLTLVPGYTI